MPCPVLHGRIDPGEHAGRRALHDAHADAHGFTPRRPNDPAVNESITVIDLVVCRDQSHVPEGYSSSGTEDSDAGLHGAGPHVCLAAVQPVHSR